MFKNVGKHALIYGLGMVLSRAVSFLMLPVYTRYLTPGDYGVMALVEMTLDFIAIIGGGQLALGVFRFYHKSDDEAEKREIVSTSFFLVGVLYLVISAAVFAGAGLLSQALFSTDAHVTVIRVAAGNLAAQSLLIVPLSFARVRDLSLLIVGTNLVKLVVTVALNILFIVGMGLGVLGIFLSSLIGNLLVGGWIAVWALRKVGVTFSRRWTRNLLRYGVPLMGMQVATFMATFSDRYFLQALSDEAVVGLYSLAYQFGFLLMMVGFTPFDMVWGPKRFDVARGEDADALLSKGFLIMNVLVLTSALGITLYVQDVLRIMSTPPFHPAARVVPVILVAYVLQAWASVQDIGILVKERTELLTVANLVSAVVAVGGYALLIPRYLEWGAAGATVVAFTVRYVLTYRYSQRLWPVQYRWRPVLILTTWVVVVCGVALALPTLPLLPSIGVRTGFVLVYFAGLWWLPVLGDDERDAARRVAAEWGAAGWDRLRRALGASS